MALSEKQKVNIDKSKSDSGESFIPEEIKIDSNGVPTIVIGIGGTGIDGLLRVKQKVSEVFKTGGSGVPDNIKFLAIDTDTYALRKEYMGTKLTVDEFLSISLPTTIGKYFQDMAKFPAYITEWLDPCLHFFPDENVSYLAIRQVGRLCLFQQAEALKNKIHDLLFPFAALADAKGKKVQVYIITGVSGCTGSGAFLDVAYIVQETIKEMYNTDDYNSCGISSGYVAAPDISDRRRFDCTGIHEDYIYVNGYAALKELDYLMNLKTNGDVFRQQYSQRMIVESQNAPFDFVHLVSGSFINSTPVENYYDRALQTIAESIVSFISAAYKPVGNCEVGIIQLNTKISFQYESPLCEYGPIHEMEEVYEKRRKDCSYSMGCHLYMNKQTGKYWFDLPSVIPGSDFDEGAPCESEIRRRERVKNVFDRAVRYGVIRADAIDGFYKAIFAGDFDVQAALEECKVDGVFVYEKLRDLKLTVENYLKPENDLPYLESEKEQNKLVMICSAKTEENALKWFYVCYGFVQKVEKEVEKYEKIERDSGEVIALCEESEKRKKNIPMFVKMLVIGAIDCTRLPIIFYLSKNNNIGEIELGVKRTLIVPDYLEFSIYKLLFENRDKSKINDLVFNVILEEAETEIELLERAPDYEVKVDEVRRTFEDMQKKIAYSIDGTPLKNEIKAFYDECVETIQKML